MIEEKIKNQKIIEEENQISKDLCLRQEVNIKNEIPTSLPLAGNKTPKMKFLSPF